MVKDEIHSILSDTRQLLEEKEFEKAEILYVLENTEDIKSIDDIKDIENIKNINDVKSIEDFKTTFKADAYLDPFF